VSPDHNELDGRQIVDGQFFKASGDSTGFLEPTDTTLNNIATAVLLDIEARGTSPAVPDLITSLRNDGTDMMPAQPLPNTAMAIRPVCGHLLWTPPAARPMDAYRFEHRFSVERLTSLTCAEPDCQW
jgi:hypothetical protein